MNSVWSKVETVPFVVFAFSVFDIHIFNLTQFIKKYIMHTFSFYSRNASVTFVSSNRMKFNASVTPENPQFPIKSVDSTDSLQGPP